MSSSPIRGSEASVDTIQDDGQTEDAIALSLGGDELGRTFAGSPKLGQELQDDLELLDALNMDDDVGRSQDIATSDDAGEHLQPERLEHSIEPDLRRPSSPGDSLSSPDDLPSIHDTFPISPNSSTYASPASGHRQSPSSSLRPFDRRFLSRLSPSQRSLASSRAGSPGVLNLHSRQSSLTSTISKDTGDSDKPSVPWEVIRWTKLRKITDQAFSEAGKRSFGKCTCMAVSVVVALGTSKGLILIFDYQQTLKSIIGNGTKAAESGAVTSIAVSTDHMTVAGGHADGSIFTWELAKSARPFLQIPPMAHSDLRDRKTDGHVSGVAILHLGFLGTRHTALASADSRGMAFSHLATRGLGAAGRSINTRRILGRYPTDVSAAERPRKPSSVLAFSPLPLGNVDQVTDNMGLVAILTPYLLVIVSTTPIAQTQHKASRPKEVAAHSVLSGCLAWFPAVKLKRKDPRTDRLTSRTKLVYCWSNVLTVLEVDEIIAEETIDREKPPSLSFRPVSRWRADEAIVAVQWLSRSVLGVLTVTQQLMILEDVSMKITDCSDLIQKHIFHQDTFSIQLQSVVEPLDGDGGTPVYGVIADSFYASLRIHRGRIFLLGFDDVSVGSLSNWSDRLEAQIDAGNYLDAIRLATSYYNGDTNPLTVGLSDDDSSRHAMVKDKLLDTIVRAIDHTFRRSLLPGIGTRGAPHVTILSELCFVACVNTEEPDFLLDNVYTAFEEGGSVDIFLQTLEPYVLGGQIFQVPPTVLKELVSHYSSLGLEGRLEEMICHLDTSTMDIDQITTLCKQFGLYDALLYVWIQALGDFITPLVELLALITDIHTSDDGNRTATNRTPNDITHATKMFPYLSYILTGRVYPTGIDMDATRARRAKSDLYSFIFAGKTIDWPRNSDKRLLTRRQGQIESSFPYLRLLLLFDAPSFLESMNEAFEDNYLNPETDDQDSSSSQAPPNNIQAFSINRQYIITVLLEVMSIDFPVQDTIYLDMFIARNLPKFPQFILLSGTALHRAIVALCRHPSSELADDCQLSVEYLLSVYHPPDIESLIPLLQGASFHRVLKSIYKADKQYARLLETCFSDTDDRNAVYECIGDCLRPRAGLNERQTRDVITVIKSHAHDLATIDPTKAARTISAFAPDLHNDMLNSINDLPRLQCQYLASLLESTGSRVGAVKNPDFIELYIRLLCQFDPSHVADYINTLSNTSPDLHLESILPALESSGVVDGSVVLLAREGQVARAMKRLTDHLTTLEAALAGLLDGEHESPDIENTEEAIHDVVAGIEKYTLVGIWLCQGGYRDIPLTSRSVSTNARGKMSEAREEERELRPKRTTRNLAALGKGPLTADEQLWLDLILTIVRITQTASSLPSRHQSTAVQSLQIEFPDAVASTLRLLVQRIFTALLSLTSSPTSTPSSTVSSSYSPPSFLHILLAFLTRSAQTSTLSSLRPVLATIFSTYTYETSLLTLATQLLDADLFLSVKRNDRQRRQGWRAGRSSCEGCGARLWGAGVGGGVWTSWEAKQGADEKRRVALLETARQSDPSTTRDSTTSRDPTSDVVIVPAVSTPTPDPISTNPQPDPNPADSKLGPIAVFKCGHVYHESCLKSLQADSNPEAQGETQPEAEAEAEASKATDIQSQTTPSRRKYTCVICQ